MNPLALAERLQDDYRLIPRRCMALRGALDVTALSAEPRGEAQYVALTRRGADDVDRPRVVPDFAWPEQKIAVFCDGWQHHSSPEQRSQDEEKRAELRAAGWDVGAFWGGQITDDAERCAHEVLHLLEGMVR